MSDGLSGRVQRNPPPSPTFSVVTSGTNQLLIPVGDAEAAGFWDGTAAGELRIQACVNCGRLRHPPRPMCPYCQSTERTWRTMSGKGTLWSYVVPHPPLLPGFAELAPYNVVVVALDEDPVIRLAGNIVPKESVEPKPSAERKEGSVKNEATAKGSTGTAGFPELDPVINAVDPETLEIGARVRVVFGIRRGRDDKEAVLPYWVLDEPS